ncbi:hypothetical protein ARAM_004842, partial [Aspergillus rambellii]
LEPYVDFLNIMTYDIRTLAFFFSPLYKAKQSKAKQSKAKQSKAKLMIVEKDGTWDAPIPSLGPHALAHTNLTEINQALELLWRNNINPHRINLGLAFYGRSFTLEDPQCTQPGCRYRDAGRAGPCTNTAGVLSATEIQGILASGGGGGGGMRARQTLDVAAAVQIVVWDQDQWVSWDDEVTLGLKVEFANRRCLGGTMADGEEEGGGAVAWGGWMGTDLGTGGRNGTTV